MSKWKLQIPVGAQDYLFDEYYNKKILEKKLLEFFYKCGYLGIDSPTFEYYDVFNDTRTIEQEKMYKLFDDYGRILVLRPEMTTPITRIAGTKLKKEKLPIRVSYISNVFRYAQPQSGIQREFTQAGIELIGEQSPEADAEVISTAITCLKDIGIKDFQVDLGQVNFFKGIMEAAGLDGKVSKDEIEELREYIDSKNNTAVKDLLDRFDIDKNSKKLILMLPTLYGKPEIIKRASQLELNNRSRKALENLEEACNLLKDYGLEDYISVDLGMVQSLDYYTGIVFKGFVRNLGLSVLGGGRYDKLAKNYGRDLPATGFALGVKRILLAMEEQKQLKKCPKLDYLVLYTSQYRGKAFEVCTHLRVKGYSAVMELTDISNVDLKSNKGKNSMVDKTANYIIIKDNIVVETNKQGEITLEELYNSI